MKIATVNLMKGSGKSTLALNLGAALAQSGRSVLVVDADPESPLEDALDLSDSGVVLDRTARQIMRSTPVTGMSLLCGTGKAFEWGGAESSTREALRRLSQEFEVVLLDTGSRRGKALENVLRLADEAIVPMPSDGASIRALTGTLQALLEARAENAALKLRAIVRTQSSPAQIGDSASVGTWETIEALYPRLILQTAVPQDASVEQSRRARKPVVQLFPSAPATMAFHALAKELGLSDGAPIRRLAEPQAPADVAATILDVEVANYMNPAATAPPARPRQPTGVFSAVLGWLSSVFGRK